MSERTTIVSPWIIGGAGRLRDLFELPPWLFFLLVFASNVVRHYLITSVILCFLWLCQGPGFGWVSAAGITIGLAVVALILGTGIRCLVALQWHGLLWFFQSIYRVAMVKLKWSNALFYGSVNERRDYDSVPTMWFIHPTRRGVRGFVWSGKKGLPLWKIPGSGDNINAVFGSADIRIKSLDDGFSKGWVEIMWVDALSDTIDVSRLEPQEDGHIPFGIDADGEVISLNPERSLLIVGESGSGKSSTLWSLMYGMQVIGLPYRLHVIDPAGGVELSNLDGSEYTANYISKSQDVEELIRKIRKEMNHVLDEMKMDGIRKIKIGDDGRKLNIILIDELLLLSKLLKDGADSPLGELLAIGRKAGFVVWACSQLAQADTLGRIRDLIPQRICMAVRSADMTDAVLGVGAEKAGARCTKIPQQLPGVGYVYREGQNGFLRFRSAYVDDELAERIAHGEEVVITRELEEPLEPDVEIRES